MLGHNVMFAQAMVLCFGKEAEKLADESYREIWTMIFDMRLQAIAMLKCCKRSEHKIVFGLW